MDELLPFEKFKRKTVMRKEATTNPDLGCKPEDRPTKEIIKYGIVNIDKPKGPTSHQVSDFTQRILNIRKAGHSGTLDPAVTGVLPIALGQGTKVVQALLNAGKEYIALMHLHKKVDAETIRKVCHSFVGEIEQIPPIKSAVKRQKRQRSVYYFNIYEVDGKDVLFKVGCEAGTYIRKLIHDIGAKLGGAHMAELRRTKAGPFGESTLVTLQDLSDAHHYWEEEQSEGELRMLIQPIESGVKHLPKVWVFDQAVDSICHGVDLKIPGVVKLHDKVEKGEVVAIMTLKEELVALGTAATPFAALLKKEKGVAVKTHKVFMQRGLYKRT